MKSDGLWPESALDSILVAFPSGKPVSTFPGNALVLLRHKFLRDCRGVEAPQHGHLGKRLTIAAMSLRRMVAIEFGMCRSGRNGGSPGSITVGYARLPEQRDGTRS